MDFLVFSLPEENIFKGLTHKITTFVEPQRRQQGTICTKNTGYSTEK
jgi:hypothetical protein